MSFQDLIITPFYILVLTIFFYFIRPFVTDRRTRKYFLPALWIRFAGALALGAVYQFYYGGSDTFNYWEHGSKWIYEAFKTDTSIGLKMLFSKGGDHVMDDTYWYSSRIWYYRDIHSYTIVRIAGFFDLFTLHTYSATSLFFSAFSFSGLWAMFFVITLKYPSQPFKLAIAILFVPSVLFWGSGILKDTITLGAIGWLTWSLFRILELKKWGFLEILIGALMSMLIFSIKIYILLCFMPLISVWLLFKNLSRVKSLLLKLLLVPLFLIVFGSAGYFTLDTISKDSKRYSIENLAQRAYITAYDIRYGWGARNGGDGGYDIGLPDGTVSGMLKLMPAAINVTLFRPYLWEARNPLMILSAIESLMISILFLRFLYKRNFHFVLKDPFLCFCLAFVLLFSFAVGVSTFNFGTLMRYKIPILPFTLIILLLEDKNENSHFRRRPGV